METDGKRLLLAVAVAMGLMLAWNFLFPPEPPKDESDTEKTADGGEEAGEGDRPDGGGSDGTGAEAEAEAEQKPRGPEKELVLEQDIARATFSTYGGVLKSYQLKIPRFADIDLVRTEEQEGYVFHTDFEGSTFELPPDAEWQGEKVSDDKVVFRYQDDNLRVEKRFTLDAEHFLVLLEVEFASLSKEQKAMQTMHLTLSSFQDPTADVGGGMASVPVEWKAACHIGDELETASQKGLRKKTRQWSGDVGWAGFVHSYFLAAVAPDGEEQMSCRLEPVKGGRKGAMRVTLDYPQVTLAPGDPSYTWKSTAFIGPKYLDKLDSVSELVGYDTNLREAVDLGWFEIIARPMLWLLKWFYGFLGNWGLAIICLTLVVKTLLLPWTHKSMVGMKKMSTLAPRMKELQEKYKDDRAALQARTMELYKQEGVNPLSSCLPMLLQMPIWIALYRMLMYAAELYRAPFIPGWINDLTSADPYYILPILVTLIMFVQAKFTPSTGGGAQQTMMKYGIPLMFGGFSFFFPAGLTLYIFTNTVLTSLHHVVIRRGEAKTKAGAAVAKGASKSTEASDEDDGDAGESADDDGDDAPGKGGAAQTSTQRSGQKSGKRSSKGSSKKSGKRSGKKSKKGRR